MAWKYPANLRPEWRKVVWRGAATPNGHGHPIVRNPRRDPILARERAERQGQLSWVRSHNRGFTVRGDGAADTGVRAPFELCLDAGVPYLKGASLTYEAAGQGRAIADVDVGVAERCDGIAHATGPRR
jgi:hypothetical protein